MSLFQELISRDSRQLLKLVSMNEARNDCTLADKSLYDFVTQAQSCNTQIHH